MTGDNTQEIIPGDGCECHPGYTAEVEAGMDGGGPGRDRLIYLLLAHLFGIFGAHNLYIERFARGIVQLLLTICSLGLLIPVTGVWAILDMFRVKSDGQGLPLRRGRETRPLAVIAAGLSAVYLILFLIGLSATAFIVYEHVARKYRSSGDSDNPAICISRIRQLGHALQMYRDEFDTFPPESGPDGWTALVTAEVLAPSHLLLCSRFDGFMRNNPATDPISHSSFYYMAGADPDSGKWPVVIEAPGNHSQPVSTLLTVDGTASLVAYPEAVETLEELLLYQASLEPDPDIAEFLRQKAAELED